MNENGGIADIEMIKNGVRIALGYGDAGGYNMGTQVTIVSLTSHIYLLYTNIVLDLLSLKLSSSRKCHMS
jgi:hypothetical protein